MAPRKKPAASPLFTRRKVEVAAEGAWVSGDQVEALGVGALLVRGLTCDAARDAFNSKARATPASGRAPDKSILPSVHARHTREVLSEVCILDARDLPFGADQIRKMVLDAGYEDLIRACIYACQAVDVQSQEADQSEALAGNS